MSDIEAGKIEYWKDGQGEWRYRVVARNGEVVDRSHEGYKNRGYALQRASSKWHKPGVDLVEIPRPNEEDE